MKIPIRPALLVAFGTLGVGLGPSAQAYDTMIVRDNGQVVYDATANLSWISNANLAATNTFGVSGINSGGAMSWYTALQWITAVNAANYLGFSDWRLPITLQPDVTCSSQSGGVSSGYNCTGSEMGNLFYNGLGEVPVNDITSVHNASYTLFSNVQSIGYWSSTEYAPNTYDAWIFFGYGLQGSTPKTYNFYAMAVRTGDVAPAPEPDSYVMMLAGLSLVSLAFCKRKMS